MDVRKRLEEGHNKMITLAIIKYVGQDKKRFKELMDIFLGNEYRPTQRAAWPMSYVTAEHPQLIAPYIDKLIGKLEQKENHPAIPRNILRIFQDFDLPEKYEGRVVDYCFSVLMSEAEPVAVRAFAITVAARICGKYPELARELVVILKEMIQLPQTAAITHRAMKALKSLARTQAGEQ
jgi:hypothetical protein